MITISTLKQFINVKTHKKGGVHKMARDSKSSKSGGQNIRSRNKSNRNITGNINELISQLGSMAFRTNNGEDIERLNLQFNDILRGETDGFNRSGGDDTTSFLSKLFRDSNSRLAQTDTVMDQLNNIFDDSSNEGSIRSFINEAYRNRMLKQSDLHEVASQLIELREAILITRDAIISSDIVEGRMTRNLKFANTTEEQKDELTSTVESIERKFDLQTKIKNFIIPKTLEYGEYYAYIIPYSKIFGDFMKRKEKMKLGYNAYTETTLYEYVMNDPNDKNGKAFYESVNDMFDTHYKKEYNPKTDTISKMDVDAENREMKSAFTESINNMMKNVIICTDPVPLPLIEEGIDSTDFFMENFIDPTTFNESDINIDNIGKDSYFNRVIKSDNGDGVYTPHRKNNREYDGDKSYERDFKNIHDCYIKMIDPVHLLPVQIMTKRVGYYYVQCEENLPVSGVVSSSLYYNRFEDNRRETTIVDSIAQRIVQAFDKKFLESNPKFKELIVEALNYYNLNEQRVRFQFIPQEYVVAFKVSEDENGNGTSIIEPSLFYAKLYLMLLLFKMMSIILYSNDTRINYVRNSGIDKNVRKKIEEIARTKQQRSITVMDMFSYTSLVNKLGVGAETYIPTGKSGERGLETEVIQGQDVQMNSDLMDNLKKAYILGTGVPDAIMNYMNEADFAKSLELANTRFQGRVVNYQFDFNVGITEMYRRILRWSTNTDEEAIIGFEFSFSPPKASNGQIKGDLLQNFDTYSQFMISLFFGQQNADNPDFEKQIRKLKLLLARDYLPMINFDTIYNLFKSAKIEGLEEELIPMGVEEEDDELEGL